jgi:hypothetical protein
VVRETNMKTKVKTTNVKTNVTTPTSKFQVGQHYQYGDEGPVFRVRKVDQFGTADMIAVTSITGYYLNVSSKHPDPNGWRGPLRESEIEKINAGQERRKVEFERRQEMNRMDQMMQLSVVAVKGERRGHGN